MRKPWASYRMGLLVSLADPVEAAAYLNEALREGTKEVFLLALRDVAAARGIAGLAEESSLNRENLYRMLSSGGNPELASLNALLGAMGLKLAIETDPKAA